MRNLISDIINALMKKIAQKTDTGLVVVITGDGKGKTTSALGMALRAVGHGMKVSIISFIKGDMYSGEIDAVKRLSPDVELHIAGLGFVGIRGDRQSFEEHKEAAQKAMGLAKKHLTSGRFGIIILDEINNAIELKLVDVSQTLELIDIKPPAVHLILTGRGAHKELIEKADTVTEVKEIKHAFRKGIKPQRGIDY